MPVERWRQIFGDQIQVAGNLLQAGCIESAEMSLECLSSVDAGDVRQREVSQVGKLSERSLLKRCDLFVVRLCHVVVAQAVAGLVVDLEARIKLEHLQQLESRQRKRIINWNSI